MAQTILPWYRRVRRWGQTNITEADPPGYDLDFWREHWRRTRVQGVIINAGGIVAYYPSRFPLQYRAAHLGDRDLFGDVSRAAREQGLAVLARMDSSRADERFHEAHPDWFAVDRDAKPYRAQDRYIACVNSPYYSEYLPQVLGEIIERYAPDGFTDNSWSGLGRGSICHCGHCSKAFAQAVGGDLPAKADWNDPAYRRWVKWCYACRVGVWDRFAEVTRRLGGEHCLWLGMLNGDPVGQCHALHDLHALGKRSPIIMCDQQSRDRVNGFEQNAWSGKLLHGLAGWDAQIPQSMAMYVRGERPFRVASNPPEESRLWMIQGFAGGISPWWHHIGARHEDRRQYDTAEPLMRFHEQHEQYLYERRPLASVGIVWSQQNIDYFGRDDAGSRVSLPIRGWTMAMTRARIPCLPVHADQIDEWAEQLAVLVLPELGAMSPSQVQSVRRFVERGGSLIVSGESSMYDQWGERLQQPALGDLLGIRVSGDVAEASPPASSSWEVFADHTYLRLPGAPRHPIFAGFDRTDILPFGGRLQNVTAEAGTQVLATFVPPVPIYPPEFSWMRTPATDRPALLAREHSSGSRVAYLAADIDRCYARHRLPDHGDLLANILRWCAEQSIPLKVAGPGYIDCQLYQQGERLILHMVNLTHAQAWPGYVQEHIAVGPLDVAVRTDARPGTARLLVRGEAIDVSVADGWARFRVPAVMDHEMIVLG
jgi:hypothetical protein